MGGGGKEGTNADGGVGAGTGGVLRPKVVDDATVGAAEYRAQFELD